MSIYITNRDHISTSALYRPNEAYLEHGLFNWGKHKYIKRTGTPGHYVYTYAEDLKKAGQRVSSGAKNLVSRASTSARNARQAVARATGVQQRRAYKNAQAEQKKWLSRLNANRRYMGVYGKNFTGGFANKAPYQQPSRYVEKNLNRAFDNTNRARKAYLKTPLGKLAIVGEWLQDVPSDVKSGVDDFLASKVGVRGRRSVRNARDQYVKHYKEYRNSRRDPYYEDYVSTCRNYGKTFLGSMEKILRTKYAHANPFLTINEMTNGAWAGQSYYKK